MPTRLPPQRARASGASVQKHGSLRLFVLAFLLLFIPMVLLARLLSATQKRARELAALQPEGKPTDHR